VVEVAVEAGVCFEVRLDGGRGGGGGGGGGDGNS